MLQELLKSLLSDSSSNPDSSTQCKHCGSYFNVKDSIGFQTSRENFTCDRCYANGRRDWATDYHDENTI
jgi:hypothetical protein